MVRPKAATYGARKLTVATGRFGSGTCLSRSEGQLIQIEYQTPADYVEGSARILNTPSG
jgi:hypothetical protein